VCDIPELVVSREVVICTEERRYPKALASVSQRAPVIPGDPLLRDDRKSDVHAQEADGGMGADGTAGCCPAAPR
jgi:hypothetical protein